MSVAIGVTGFGRCGSSMLMKMLDVGGIPPVFGSSDVAYELAGGLADFSRYPTDLLGGRAVKLLDYGQWFAGSGLPGTKWRFVWLDRDHEQQARSQAKFLREIVGLDVDWRDLARSYARDRDKLIRWYEQRGRVYVTTYESLLTDAVGESARLAEFLPQLDVVQAARVPFDRSPSCAPDLAFEMGRAS